MSAYSSWLCSGWGFPPLGYEIPDGAGSCEDVEKAKTAVSDAEARLVEAENRYLESMKFQMVLDHKSESILWKPPADSSLYSGGMTRKNALDYAVWLERSSKLRAESQIKKLKEKHKIGE